MPSEAKGKGGGLLPFSDPGEAAAWVRRAGALGHRVKGFHRPQ